MGVTSVWRPPVAECAIELNGKGFGRSKTLDRDTKNAPDVSIGGMRSLGCPNKLTNW